jgi:N-acylglucosamine 2-epimerase
MIDELKERYRRNLFESVIPFWERHSLDGEHGGQLHCLTRDGTVFDTRKYVWMQGRAVWMFSKLYNDVEKRPEWLKAARSILDFLLAHAKDEQGRFYFSLTREGAPVFRQRKPYAGFFVFLALVEYSKTGAAGSEGYVEQAIRLYERVQLWIDDGRLLRRPSLAGQTAVRQLADVMVRASMAMELHAVDPDVSYRLTLRKCLEQAREHWLPKKRTLLENLPLGGVDYKSSPDTRLLCPGSALEVAWFLWHALEELGEKDAAYEKFLLDVIEGSLELGWDGEHGGLYYFMDAEGLPPLQLEANMKLWWPHTEAIYTLVLAYTKTGDAKWLEWLKRVDEYVFRTFVDWEYGEWFGYCDRYGRPALQLKGGPYKGFFHVPRCLLFSLRRLDSLRS